MCKKVLTQDQYKNPGLKAHFCFMNGHKGLVKRRFQLR